MKKCELCKFWTQLKPEGICSQNVKLDNGIFAKRITFDDYGCTLQEEDKTKFDFRIWIDKEDKAHITGVFSKNTLLLAKEEIENKLKDFRWVK